MSPMPIILCYTHNQCIPITKILILWMCDIYLPTIISSISVALLLTLLQISMVNIVELLLKIDVSDDIKADIITASSRPIRSRR